VSSIRILVVDDYKDWRTQVRLLLQGRPECQIIFEASDGLEGVQRAEELKPDLILLDVGLPKLNGIEAAGRIRRRSPGSKIVFVSGNSSRDVVQVAMSTGAYGYVYKVQFVSGGIDRDALTDPPGASAPSHHEILFYSDDEVLLDRLVRFVAAALKTGDVAIVVATESHRDHLVQRLKTEGVDVDAAIKEGKYVPVDAGGTLRIFMVNEMPDSARFFEVVGGLIEEAAKKSTTEHPRIAVFGELVSLLWNEDNRDAALRLEKLWNQLARSYEIDLLCGYAKSNFHGKKDEHVFQEICAEHSVVFRA
jgi:CheY-like chemotaxis protein